MKMANCLEKASFFIQMENLISEITFKVNDKEKVCIPGQTAGNMMGNGMRIRNMDKVG